MLDHAPSRLAGVLLGVLATLGAIADEPVVGPQQRIDVAGSTFASNETTGAVATTNPQEIIASWNDWRESPVVSNEVIRSGVALSMNGGLTWSDFVVRPPLANQSGVEGDPMTAHDPRTGAVWVGAISFSGNGGLYVARKNAGDNFFQPSVMADTGSGIDKCWMVAGRNEITPDSTRLYIAYNLGVISSDDLGGSWTNPVSLGSGIGFLPRVGPGGEVYVSYWNFGGAQFRIARSVDGGSSYVDRLIAPRMDNWSLGTDNNRFPGEFRVPAFAGIAVHPINGTLYAVFPDTTDQAGSQFNVDVYFTKSFDQGDTWLPPVILNGEGPFVGDQFFPWIEIDSSGRLHVVYLDSRHTSQPDTAADGLFDAYYAYSEDDGATWFEARLTPQPWNSDDDGLERSSQFIGDYLGIALTDDTVWPIYLDTQNGDTDIFTNKISFAPCSPPGEVSGLRVSVLADDTRLRFTWSTSEPVQGYVLFEDFTSQGSFTNVAGSASAFLPRIDVDTPPGSRYYLIAAENSCGLGPKQSEESSLP